MGRRDEPSDLAQLGRAATSSTWVPLPNLVLEGPALVGGPGLVRQLRWYGNQHETLTVRLWQTLTVRL